MNNTNNSSARMSYDIAKQVLYNAWIGDFLKANKGNMALASKECLHWVNGRKLSQGEVRSEVELNTTSNSFVFAVTDNQTNSTGVDFNTQRLLPQQDSLIVSEYQILVGQPASRTDHAYTLHSYGNTQVFAAADAAALNSTFYCNGYFEMAVNNDIIIPYRGLINHWYKPQTQQTAALGAGSPQDQFRGAEDAYITDEPNILLIGSKNYVPKIILPGSLASAAPFLRCILRWTGVYAQNSTSIN